MTSRKWRVCAIAASTAAAPAAHRAAPADQRLGADRADPSKVDVAHSRWNASPV